jgi:hypothetical protein
VNITVSKKKQEMRSDPFLELIGKTQKLVQTNSVTLVGVLIGIAFVVLLYGGYRWMQDRSMANAEDAFGRAITAYASRDEAKTIEFLTIVADNHKNTPHAAYSAFMLGSILLGESKYDEAIQWLKEAATNKRSAGFVSGAANEALAAAYEGKGDLASAVSAAEQALKDPKVAYRYPALRWKLALLNNEMKRSDQALTYCRQIVSDTLAAGYRQKALGLMAELQSQSKS